jgi:hypothetical protein
METLRLPKRTRTTLTKMAGTALEFLPMTGAPSDSGPGRKIFFPIPLKNNPDCMEDFLYVFAESKLPFHPNETDIGFTETDVVDSTGIYLFRKRGEQALGQVYTLETLFREVFTDLSLQNRMICKLAEMKILVHLDQEFIEAANADRVGRTPEDFLRITRLN